MSNAFPNMIPNEPPPLDGFDEDEGDDGYSGLNLDILNDPSPMSSPQRKLPVLANKDNPSPLPNLTPSPNPSTPEKSSVNSVNCVTVNGSSTIVNGDEEEEEIILPPPYSSHVNFNNLIVVKTSDLDSNSNEDRNEEGDDFGDFRSSEFDTGISNVSTAAEVPNDLSQSMSATFSGSGHSSEEPSIEVNGVQSDISLTATSIAFDELVTSVVGIVDDVEDQSFSDCPDSQSKSHASSPSPDSNPSNELENDEFEDFQEPCIATTIPATTTVVSEQEQSSSIPATTPLEVEDDYGDFSTSTFVSSQLVSSSGVPPSVEIEDDEFGDFSSRVVHVQDDFVATASPPDTLLDSFQNFSLQPVSAVSTQETVSSLPSEFELGDNDDEDDDFGDFHCSNINAPKPILPEPTAILGKRMLPPLRTSFVGFSADDFDESPAVPVRRSSLLDTSNTSELFPVLEPTTSSLSSHKVANSASSPSAFDEDFGDFLSSEKNDHLQDFTPVPASFTRKDSQVDPKYESMVSSVFEQPSKVQSTSPHVHSLRSIDKELDSKTNYAWTCIQDFEGSHGLKFKWLNSGSHRHLLRSLKVDSSTILYSGRWGAIEVPKFAASLGDIPLIPLQPETSSLSTPLKPTKTHSSPMSDFQEFQSHKTTSSAASTTTANTDANHSLSSNSNSIKPETKISEPTLAQLSDLSYRRTEELVFPSSPMFHEY